MSDKVREGLACSGIHKNAGGSIKREHVAAFDVWQGSPCQPHNPGIGTIGAAVLNTLASAQSLRSHQYAIERFIYWYFGILTLTESSAQIGQILDDNLRFPPLFRAKTFGPTKREIGTMLAWMLHSSPWRISDPGQLAHAGSRARQRQDQDRQALDLRTRRQKCWRLRLLLSGSLTRKIARANIWRCP
jgi:hypothetical protein